MTDTDRTPYERRLVNTVNEFLMTTRSAFNEDLAPRLTCAEVEALAALHRVVGSDPSDLLAAHADGDDEGDDHYVINVDPR